MPFSLCSASSFFQRLMECVLRGRMWISCYALLDCVIIFIIGLVAQYVVELAVVLEILAGVRFSLKVSKCSFAAAQMKYLGHDPTPRGIQPTARLVKAFVGFPRPKNEVRRIVALAGYYRRFCNVLWNQYGTIHLSITKTCCVAMNKKKHSTGQRHG